MGIHELEKDLFKKWEEHLKQRIDAKTVDNLICYDGLHFTGTPDKSTGWWKMHPDNKEEELWRTARIRPLFLTKDHNLQGDKYGVDVREETALRNDTDNIYYPFYARYLMLLYGLSKINPENGSYPPLEEAKDPDNYLNNFYEAPVVRINLKKIAGEKKCLEEILQDYIQNDKDFIVRQINLYHPNVVVCCDGTEFQARSQESDPITNPIMDMLKEEVYPDMQRTKFKEKESYTVYYSAASRVVILHVWHPSMRVSYQEYYSAITELSNFFKESPNSI